MKDSLVAINIVNDNKLLNINGNGVPLLFYWNGEDEVLDSIFKMDIFKAKIYDVINNVNNYTNSKIALFYFKYIEYKIPNLDSFDKVNDFYYSYLGTIEKEDYIHIPNNYLIKQYIYLVPLK